MQFKRKTINILNDTNRLIGDSRSLSKPELKSKVQELVDSGDFRLLTVISDNISSIVSVETDRTSYEDYNREVIEDIGNFIRDYRIKDICTIINIDSCLNMLKRYLDYVKSSNLLDYPTSIDSVRFINGVSKATSIAYLNNKIDILECFKEYVQLENRGTLDKYIGFT